MLILLLCLIGQENGHGDKRQVDTVEGERRNDGWTDGNELGKQHNGKKKREENWTNKYQKTKDEKMEKDDRKHETNVARRRTRQEMR